MTTEKSFAESNHGFWHDLLPLSEVYLRRLNRSLSRFVAPMINQAQSSERGVINELGFRLFTKASHLDSSSPVWSPEVISNEAVATLGYIGRMRQFGRRTPPPLSQMGIIEAQFVARRLLSFFKEINCVNLVCAPVFQGCGWIATCEGDVYSQGVLFEIKAGNRLFRGIDLRQLLCYTALNFASKQYDIHSICLINPRSGTYFNASLNEVCYGVAGRPSIEILSSIMEYISEPAERYQTG